MCMTLYPAVLSKTILYAGEALIDGKLVHVLGYQNTAKNESKGPNAMILPFPTSIAMGPGNVVDTSECKNVLKKYGDMFKVTSRSLNDGVRFNHSATDEYLGKTINIER